MFITRITSLFPLLLMAPEVKYLFTGAALPGALLAGFRSRRPAGR
jgi:hypothetical protein